MRKEPTVDANMSDERAKRDISTPRISPTGIESNFCHQSLEPLTSLGAGSRLTQIIIASPAPALGSSRHLGHDWPTRTGAELTLDDPVLVAR